MTLREYLMEDQFLRALKHCQRSIMAGSPFRSIRMCIVTMHRYHSLKMMRVVEASAYKLFTI